MSPENAFQALAPEGIAWETLNQANLQYVFAEANRKNGRELLTFIENLKILSQIIGDEITRNPYSESAESYRLYDIFKNLATFLDGVLAGKTAAAAQIQIER